jgi:hypothetical protein
VHGQVGRLDAGAAIEHALERPLPVKTLPAAEAEARWAVHRSPSM